MRFFEHGDVLGQVELNSVRLESDVKYEYTLSVSIRCTSPVECFMGGIMLVSPEEQKRYFRNL